MRRERFQASQGASPEGSHPASGIDARDPAIPRALPPAVSVVVALVLVLATPLAAVADEAPPSPAGANPDSTGSPADGDRDDQEEPAASVSGSVTSRATFSGGSGNDRLSTRFSLEWTAGAWSGGLTANLDNSDSGDIWRARGVGSLDIPERWVGWRGRIADRHPVELRLGTANGLRFGEGLLLGAASFEGVQLVVDGPKRMRWVALAGDTDAIDPDDLAPEPITLFPGEEQLGTKGRLAGVRAEIHPKDELLFGVNLLGAEGGDGARTGLASVDTSWSRGMVDFSGEFAGCENGGTGLFTRTTLSRNETWAVSLEARRYDDFLSPVGNAPVYAGLTGGDARNETGGLVRYDFSPNRTVSGSLSADWSRSEDKTTGRMIQRLDNRLALHFVLSKTTALAWGLEHETTNDGHDGTIHSLLATTAFKKGGRLAARLQIDRATEDPRDSLRLSYRLPLWNRRLTLLVDDTLMLEGSRMTNEFEAGGSLKIGDASFLTVRGTLADGPDSVDVTFYQRF